MLFKVDFHIHTPASSCYSDNVISDSGVKTYPQDIIGKSVAAGLDAIAITDHNSIKGLELIMEVAHNSRLCIFPGIEISAKGGHVIGLWELATPLLHLQDLLHALGFNGDSEGQGYCQTEFGMDTVFRYINDAGGMAIAAHIDRRPKGFVASEELPLQEKQRIYGSSFLQALEITILEDKPGWNKGKENFQPGMACIQGSDAHALDEIGRRPIYLEIPDLSLQSIGLAFKEFNTRIFFPGEVRPN